jgi:D-arabinose 1-dehydrogenase-like Zn-dependent alcohol dehydrogenase
LKVAAGTTELREFDLPDLPPDAALMKVEVAGVCGTDVSQYKLPLRGAPLIMGHENVGYRQGGSAFASIGRKGIVFSNSTCRRCEWDHMGSTI